MDETVEWFFMKPRSSDNDKAAEKETITADELKNKTMKNKISVAVLQL
jgi:hypothetical protein